VDPLVIALLAVAAFLAAVVDAIGGGGGLITLPALWSAGLPTHEALATNKGGSVWGSGAAMVTFLRAGRVDRAQAVFAFPLGFIGSAIGVKSVLAIDKEALQPIIIALLIGAGIVLVLKKPARHVGADGGADNDAPARTRGMLVIAGLLALVIGAYDGFFGPGTGTFLIVGVVALCGRSLTRATADAKVVNFASNLAGLATFAIAGEVHWDLAIPMGMGQLIGGVVGARLALRGGARFIRIAVLVASAGLIARLTYDLIA
jgi:uncharacterized protein